MRIKSKKKLALLVSMALTVGTSMAVSPMEAYAFTSVGYSEFMNGPEGNQWVQGIYTVTKKDGSKETFVDADKAVAAALKSLADETSGSAIDFGKWVDINQKVASAKIADFQKALSSQEVTIAKSQAVSFTQADGSQVVLNAGDSAEGKVNIGADGSIKVNSNMAAIGVNGANTNINLDVAEGTTLGAVSVGVDKATVNVSGAGSITAVGTSGDCKVNGETSIGTLGVAGNLTSDTNLNVGTLSATGDVQVDGSIKADNLSAVNINANGQIEVGGKLTAEEVSANSVTLKSNATVANANTKIKADSVTIDATGTETGKVIEKLQIESKTDGTSVKVKVVTKDGSEPSEEIKNAITKAAGGADKVNIGVTSEAAETAKNTADTAIAKADEELGNVNEFAAKDAAEVAQANPFTTKLPSASDIAAIANPSTSQLAAVKATATGLKNAISSLDTEISNAESKGNTTLKAELEAKKATLQSKLDNVSSAAGMQAKAAELTAAVQQAGKTAAAPGVASARTATVVTNVMTANVTGRTSELRGFASAVDEGRPAPDNVWFQYKHTNMDVDNGDVYGKSTVKTNNYQLGYDTKVGPNDYLGAYIGTTTGNVEFNAPAVTDRTDIDNAYDFGIYGTHMLPSDQYIDYMIHTGKFDSKYNGVTWGTKDTGAMIGYGAKIAQNDRLTWNPYIQLAYDKVSVDSYMAGANYIASDDSNNWTAKLGINLLDVSGFYGGLAYSRGLSGSYNAYINGVPMPSQDNNANVLYMSLGYRANMSRNVFLDLNMEKTFADYNGWTAAGKVNFYF
ncbi:MAG: autotransporter domain-containing protein [Veillonellaceae bacterium]|nr:autotransporter domain-containing protein [Veillonellaceae bacterium]